MPRRKTIPGYVHRPYRGAVELPARIAFEGGEVEAVVLNLSAAGLFARCSAPLPIGSDVTLACTELGKVTAQVRWCLGKRVGLAFTGSSRGAARTRIARLVEESRRAEDALPFNDPDPPVAGGIAA